MELFVIGQFIDGELYRLVRKGRNYSIAGYDNLASARRGLGQSKSFNKTADFRILKADGLTEAE